jgi:hypothetical protein
MTVVIAAILRCLGDAAGPAAAALAILAACAVVGTAAIPRRLRPAHARVGVLAAISVGAGIVGWTTWIAGSLLGTWAVPLVAGMLVLLSIRHLRPLARGVRRLSTELLALARRNWGPAVVLGVVVLLTATNLLLPLTDSDGLRYHVALPKLFLLEGKVFLYPYDVTGAFPQLAEMLNLLGLQLSRGETAKFLHWGFFLLTLATLAVIVHRGRRYRTAAMLAPVFLASSPAASALAAYAFVDYTATFHLAVGLLLTVSGGSPLLIGAVMGAALATKYTAAPGVAAVVVAATLLAPRRRRARAVLALVAPIVVAFLPFAVRNSLATGDPVFPIGHGLLHVPIAGVSPTSLAKAKDYHAAVPGLLGITWDLRQGPAQADEVAGFHHLFGFVALATVLVAPAARVLAAPVLAYLALGLAFHPPTRYLLPMFLCLSALEALAVGILTRRRARAWLTLALTVPALALSTRLLTEDFHPFDLLLGTSTRTEFLAATVPGWRAAQAVNALPPGGKVMALDFPAPYYLNRPWIAEGTLNEPPLTGWLERSATVDDVLAKLQRLDVRFLLVTPGYGGGTRRSLLPVARSARGQRLAVELRLRLVHLATLDGVDVYRVPSAHWPPTATNRASRRTPEVCMR